MYNELKQAYCDLIGKFVDALGDHGTFNPAGLPAPHIPQVGKNYEKSRVKIAFFGKETQYWFWLEEFIRAYTGGKKERNAENAYAYLTQNEKANYLKWTNNFGTSFWDYIFQFLTAFYNLKPVFTENSDYENLLESFIWGETNSMERYTVSAQPEGVEYADWEKVKNASELFDTASYVLDICRPDIMIIMDWVKDESWLTGGVKTDHEELFDHHCYYKVGNTNVYWTAHPRYLAPNIGFEQSITIILNDLEKRGIPTCHGYV
ncbi:MAG: hypothetical protein LBG26_05205 [Treponema sp.]|jgi:hypothetical protein|nr:hypothetical protein [Treponema sp.]